MDIRYNPKLEKPRPRNASFIVGKTRLNPGINTVDVKVWKNLETQPSIIQRIEWGAISVVEKSKPLEPLKSSQKSTATSGTKSK